MTPEELEEKVMELIDAHSKEMSMQDYIDAMYKIHDNIIGRINAAEEVNEAL